MQLNKSLAGMALAMLVCAQSNAAPIDIPYKPTATLMVTLESTNGWAELYSMPEEKVSAAIQNATKGDAPANDLTAAIANWSLHLTSKKKSLVMPEKEVSLTREGQTIDYSDCTTTPKKGDKLKVVYSTDDGQHRAILDVVMQEYFSYSEVPGEVLDVTIYEQCLKETHSRMFLYGTLTLSKKNEKSKPDIEKVLVQSIVEPQ